MAQGAHEIMLPRKQLVPKDRQPVEWRIDGRSWEDLDIVVRRDVFDRVKHALIWFAGILLGALASVGIDRLLFG